MTQQPLFRGGWPAQIEGDTYLLSDGSTVEGEEAALRAQDELPWPRSFRSPSGGFVTSDRYRFFDEERAVQRQANIDGDAS